MFVWAVAPSNVSLARSLALFLAIANRPCAPQQFNLPSLSLPSPPQYFMVPTITGWRPAVQNAVRRARQSQLELGASSKQRPRSGTNFLEHYKRNRSSIFPCVCDCVSLWWENDSGHCQTSLGGSSSSAYDIREFWCRLLKTTKARPSEANAAEQHINIHHHQQGDLPPVAMSPASYYQP
ncbi:acylCoA dehydrogenaselike protein putative [Anopheles sinensis]|uniref:AcylCoA dehydrogenaselike protein putative n=1 Tax=Anopheles sinensis TaxID=74873 RepID=A0A084VGP5_ANOSI|nr:acylCoA dehydrogenaselike protein putative [Anopheles sinensis]